MYIQCIENECSNMFSARIYIHGWRPMSCVSLVLFLMWMTLVSMFAAIEVRMRVSTWRDI